MSSHDLQDTGWSNKHPQKVRAFLAEIGDIHRRLLSFRTLKVFAIGFPLSFLASRYGDQATHSFLVQLAENYAPMLPGFIGGAIFRITLVILYFYSLQPTGGYLVTVACGLASGFLHSLSLSIFSSSFPRSLLEFVLPTEIAVIGAVDALVNDRIYNHLLLHSAFLFVTTGGGSAFLSQYVAGATLGAAYALAANALAQARQGERDRQIRNEYEKKKAENERRNALPLTDNLRIIVQQTPTDKLPVAIDFPRLANKIEIIDAGGQVVLPLIRDSNRAAENQMRDILYHLGQCTASPEVVQCVQSSFQECFEMDSTATKSLDRLCARFFSGEFLAENCKPVLILRACNQAAISPAVLALKTSIGQKLPYKDVRGEWFIRIVFSPDSVTVTHEKHEQSWTTKPGLEFQFVWELCLTFSLDLKDLRSTSLRIKHVTFRDTAPEEYQQSVIDQLRQYYRPDPAT